MSELNYLETYRRFCTDPHVDAETKKELASIRADEKEIKERFYTDLSFGTAGLRGVMKAGTNAMNIYTVAHATQGFASYIVSLGDEAKSRGVVIAHDCRIHAHDFAVRSAEVLAANGIHVYLFDALRPTPLLSFAIGHLHCIAGINITASHNPKQYNGYKAYWEDGAQISPEQADRVSAFIRETDIFNGVKSIPLNDAIDAGLIEIIGDKEDEAYLSEVQKQLVDPAVVEKNAEALKIVYTPLHGTGYKLVPEILSRIGVKHLHTVSKQMITDGSFPTVDFPNPEYKDAFRLGIALADDVDSDLIIATDPDADRVGIMAKDKTGEFRCLTGNQMGVLLLDYIIRSLKRQNRLPAEPYAVKSIVSTEMATKVCKQNGITMRQTFTGFKYIGECILAQQAKGNADGFLLGFEESYGYLRGDYAKDKDAVVTTMLIVEMAAYYRERSMTLIDAMDEMYDRYGVYVDGVDNIYMEGLEGKDKMDALMASLRSDPPQEIGGAKVVRFADYKAQTILSADGTTAGTDMEKSNVLSFVTAANDTIVVRPSGTEPKIKLYFLVSGDTREAASAKLDAYKTATAAWTK